MDKFGGTGNIDSLNWTNVGLKQEKEVEKMISIKSLNWTNVGLKLDSLYRVMHSRAEFKLD